MTISVWRYSHLALAVASSVLLTLAALTGIILAFQPIAEKVQPYRPGNVNEITLAGTLPELRNAYPGITELSVDANQFVQISGTDAEGKKLLAYIDPRNGKIIGYPGKENEFFQWVTALHRSLFLHETGRFFIGLTAFLLILIALSGIALVIQRQRGIRRFFSTIARDGFAQYYHVVLGRLSLIFILIIALSGTYLSLNRFGLISNPKISPRIDFDAIRSQPAVPEREFKVFRETPLSEVRSVEFPFSEDAEDYYTLKLKDRELAVNQVTGDLLSEEHYPYAILLANLSLDLHTGRSSGIWAVVLAIASANILFFIYSGFAIMFKRRANRVKNKYKADEAHFIILVGSENGSTFRFARAVHQQLLKLGERSFLTEVNQYRQFPAARQLIFMSATYGLGDPPTNASKFGALLGKYPQQQPVSYSVVGFGSHAYPDFCQFAFEADRLLSRQPWAKSLVDIHTVNDKSPAEFALWAEAWAQRSGIAIAALPEFYSARIRLRSFTVTRRTTAAGSSGAFMIHLAPKFRMRVTSGDLLAIYPAGDHRERLYSIGVVKGEIRLCVRLHPQGLGSGFLHDLAEGEKVRARIVVNAHFHFPAKAPEVIMIANGTGIAPFMGMLSKVPDPARCHLYCGFREQASFGLYEPFIRQYIIESQLHVAFSREGAKQYVSDLIVSDAATIAGVLSKGGVIMICGSLAMQKDVMEVLGRICRCELDRELSFYQSHGQVLTDCY